MKFSKKLVKGIIVLFGFFTTLFLPVDFQLVYHEGTVPKKVYADESAGRFDQSLSDSVNNLPVDRAVPGFRAQGVQDFIFQSITKILSPLFIIIGVLLAILGFYKLFTSEKDDDIKKGVNYITWGVIGILVMMSAPYIAQTIYKDVLQSGNITEQAFGVVAAEKVYNLIVFPFLKIVMYLIVGVLFIILLIHAMRFLLNPDPKIKDHAKNILISNIIGILVILGSKNIVESIYGKQQDIINRNLVSGSSLGDVGSNLLSQGNIPFLLNVLNWLFSLISFIILVLIIIQTYQLLTSPNDEALLGKIKKNFLYIFIGILIIGLGYLLVNFLIPSAV